MSTGRKKRKNPDAVDCEVVRERREAGVSRVQHLAVGRVVSYDISKDGRHSVRQEYRTEHVEVALPRTIQYPIANAVDDFFDPIAQMAQFSTGDVDGPSAPGYDADDDDDGQSPLTIQDSNLTAEEPTKEERKRTKR